MKLIAASVLFIAALVTFSIGQTTSPAAKKLFPAASDTFQIPSHGSLLNALAYIADGPGPHPVVALLHGFPGNEKNLDLAQDMRRAGWDVLYFNYRGAWGTPGNFSFGNSIEDVASAVAYLRQPENAKRLRLDPKRVVLVGHSMGGFMAVDAGAADQSILGVALISAADMPGRIPQTLSKADEPAFIKRYAAALAEEGMAPLAGCTPEGLVRELIDNNARWRFSANVDGLKTRPVFVITSDDGLAKMGDDFAASLQRAGDTHVTTAHFATDHSYNDKRIELSAALLKWLDSIVAK
jgi:pimeloyl-ACP methyl ester carboxylesterase